MSIKHTGINAHRLKTYPEDKSRENPLEVAFAEAWKKKAPTTLGYLLCGQDKRTHDYSARDAEVAATMIQWLGSHVGNSFIDEVREEFERRGKQ